MPVAADVRRRPLSGIGLLAAADRHRANAAIRVDIVDTARRPGEHGQPSLAWRWDGAAADQAAGR